MDRLNHVIGGMNRNRQERITDLENHHDRN